MANAPLSCTAPKALAINWWQAGKSARLNCTGFTCTVQETALPFTPIVDPVNLAQGQFNLLPPAPAEAALLRPGKTYGLHLVLRNALGTPIEDIRFTIEAV